MQDGFRLQALAQPLSLSSLSSQRVDYPSVYLRASERTLLRNSRSIDKCRLGAIVSALVPCCTGRRLGLGRSRLRKEESRKQELGRAASFAPSLSSGGTFSMALVWLPEQAPASALHLPLDLEADDEEGE